jgi:hypothetical protein
MASVKDTRTTAQVHLDFALGKSRVRLGNLSGKEFDDFLKAALEGINLRELRGFRPLGELLAFRPGSIVIGRRREHTLEVEVLDLPKKVSFEAIGFEECSPVDIETHIMKVCRGLTIREAVYKRNETGEETVDEKVADSWGELAYHLRGVRQFFAIRRPRNHSYAHENLVLVSFSYEKVSLENRHVITNVRVERLLLKDFRRRFGTRYPQVATELIWEMRDAHSITADQLEEQAKHFRKETVRFDRLADAVTYS